VWTCTGFFSLILFHHSFVFQQNVASLSSLDQSTVSAVDLDISSAVEDEMQQVQKDTPPSPPKGEKKSPKGNKNQESVASFVSAVDQVGVSAVDLNITKGGKAPSPPNTEVVGSKSG
jgi:uncharacterized protein (DUF305 family)